MGVPQSGPKSRLGYSASSEGNDIEIVAVGVVGLVVGSAMRMVVGVGVGAVEAVD
jgi:hypothetical protein